VVQYLDMNFLDFGHPISKLIIAALLGMFLGLRREIEAIESSKNKSFMGLRTMGLLAGMGAISTFFPAFKFLPLVFFGALAALITVVYANGSFNQGKIGITAELSALLTFWVGVLVGLGQPTLAIIVTIFLGVINAFKRDMHSFVERLSAREWKGALQLFILSGAIFPFLPREAVDPFGVLIPFNIWFIVILISGIEFLGYFLIKFFGARGGIPLIAFLGSIVSSTAVTNSFAIQSKKYSAPRIFAAGIFIALATMQVRVVIEILFLRTAEFSLLFLLVPFFMIISTLALSFYFFKQSEKKHFWQLRSPDIKFDSPFEIVPALKFGVIFVIVLLAIAIGKKYFGSFGVYSAAILSGVIDIDAIVLSVLASVKSGNITVLTAQNSIFIALIVNTLMKNFYILFLGSRDLLKSVFVGVLVSAFSGGAAFFVISLLG